MAIHDTMFFGKLLYRNREHAKPVSGEKIELVTRFLLFRNRKFRGFFSCPGKRRNRHNAFRRTLGDHKALVTVVDNDRVATASEVKRDLIDLCIRACVALPMFFYLGIKRASL